MKRATAFMVEKAAVSGGYVWSYLPDMSRRWGDRGSLNHDLDAAAGTPSMGHVFLDAYHATGDEYYYRAAEQVAGALTLAQHPSGGWNYAFDTAGPASLREWYGTVGRNAWRLEEFQHDWGNATFDDGGTSQSATFLLRLYLEKRDARYKTVLDGAVRFVLDSHTRWRVAPAVPAEERVLAPRQTGLHLVPHVQRRRDGGERRTARDVLPGPGRRAPARPDLARMNSFIVTQQPRPGRLGAAVHAGPAPAGARTYEPEALATHATASNVEHLLRFYRLTGDGSSSRGSPRRSTGSRP